MTAFGKIWAVARMTLIEARRRKVFTILLLFGIALLSSVLFFPSIDVKGRLRLIEIWSLRASAVFTAIIGLFLAGFSLPQDFETKRIYMIVTKPVSKSLVFLGRYLGYVLLLALFIGMMGLITTLFLRCVKAFSGRDFPALVAYPLVTTELFSWPGGEEMEEGQQAKAWVGFGNDKMLVWSFKGLRRSSFDQDVHAQARFIFGAENDPYRASGSVHVAVRDADGLETHRGKLQMNTNEEGDFSFPASLIRDGGTLQIAFKIGDSDGRLASRPEWVRLSERSMLFELAFARGLALILFQSMVVLSITLMSSTFLSAPLSIMLGILLYIVGSLYGYIRDGTREIDSTLTEIRTSKEKKKTVEDLPPGVLWFSSELSKLVLKVTPDFDHFDFSVWLLRDQAVSWREVAEAAGKAAPPVLVLVLLGTLVIAFRDFDR
jgi:hypothetical protein